MSAPLRQRRPAEPRERAGGPAPRTERADQEEAGRAASGSGLTPGGVLALQRLAGNAAVGTLLARMPTKGQVTSAIGVEPREDKEFKVGIISYTREMSTRDKEILNALHEYGSFLALTHIPADSGSVEKDGARILAMLDAIIERALVYRQAHKSGQVSDYCATLVSLASRERVLVKEAVAALANDPPVHSPYWISRIPQDPVQTLPPRAPMTVPAPVLGAVAQAGAQKTTEQIQTPAGHTGRWSPDTPSAQLGAHVVEHQAEYGIDMTRTSQSARSVAMSRLDALLAGDVVAPTQFGNRGGVQGMVMAEAVGKQMDQILGDVKRHTDSIKLKDPTLQRLLSRLQLIDAIAGQVDRHMGNYFVQRDAGGQVTGITGIDLDFAFGVEQGVKQEDEGAVVVDRPFRVDRPTRDPYPGMSILVDAEIAERILLITEADLHAIWDGLLAPAEVAAAVNRWKALVVLLQALNTQGKLLERSDWGGKTLTKLTKEQRSYVGHAANVSEGRRYFLGPGGESQGM